MSEIAPTHYVEVFGEALGNPGLAGVGIVIRDGSARVIERRALYLGASTPARAEFEAILSGLKFLEPHRPAAATLSTAHEAAFRQVTGRSRAHAPETIALHVQIQKLLDRLACVEFRLAAPVELHTAERLAAVAIGSRGRRQAID